MFGSTYILAAVGLVAVGSAGFATVQTEKLKSARAEILSVRAELTTCGARLQNIIEDVESDGTIDIIPDAELRNVPDHWLLAPGNSP